MGERKVRTTSKSSKSYASVHQKMSSPAPGKSNLTALFQSAPTAGNARVIRGSSATLDRLRKLNEAEIITLFTPFVPHPPSTMLAKNMDPFEPLGRALPRQVRHVPYRLDNGMTETHADFMPTSGAIITVLCAPENVLQYNPKAFELQLTFAREVTRKFEEKRMHPSVPVVVLLITNGAAQEAHEYAAKNFHTVVTIDDYTPAALANAVRSLFGP